VTKPSPVSLREARKRLKKTQSNIADAFKISQAAVSYWENLESAPHPELWQRIAEEYGVSLRLITEHFLRVRRAS